MKKSRFPALEAVLKDLIGISKELGEIRGLSDRLLATYTEDAAKRDTIAAEINRLSAHKKETIAKINGSDRTIISHQERLAKLEEWQAFIDPSSAIRSNQQ